MKGRKKFITYIIMAVMLVGISILPSQADNASPPVLTLSLNDAIDKAILNNPQVGMAAADKKKKDLAYTQAKRASVRMADSSGGGTYQANLTQYITPKVAQLEGEQAEKVYEITINGVKVEVEQAFYNLIQAKEKQTIAENALLRADDQLKIANAKFNIGSVAKQEVLAAEAAQASARAALTSARNTYHLNTMELDTIMGLDLNTVLDPQGVFTFEKQEFELQKLLDTAMVKESSIIKAQDSYEMAQWNYDYTKSYYGPYNEDTIKSEQDKITAGLSLQKTKDNLITNVNKNYYSKLALEEQYDYLLKNVELKKEVYRLTQLSYEVGMSTLLDAQKASDAEKQAELDLSDCVYQYNVLKSSLKYSIFS